MRSPSFFLLALAVVVIALLCYIAPTSAQNYSPCQQACENAVDECSDGCSAACDGQPGSCYDTCQQNCGNTEYQCMNACPDPPTASTTRRHHHATLTKVQKKQHTPKKNSLKKKSSSVSTSYNPRPIVGIFSLASSDNANETGSKIVADYVKWLEQSGSRVAVIPFNAPQAELERLFQGINGLLFTGGGLSLAQDTLYFQQALYMFDLAKAANDQGDYFPIWGTCQGFQLLNLLASMPPQNSDVLKCIYDSYNLLLPLNFTAAAPSSQLYGPAQIIPSVFDGSSGLHPTIYEALNTEALTMNLHHCGVSSADFNADPVLPSFYTPLSTNVDRKQLEFISSMEGIQYPFLATQWHPERTQFEWDLMEDLAKTPAAISSHSYISQRFMLLVKQNTHRFPTQQLEAASLIYNYVPTFTGNWTDEYPEQQTYYFNFTY